MNSQTIVERLLSSQNSDGGWSFKKGSSWVEPTALALLGLQSRSEPPLTGTCDRAVAWLLARQSHSGGWAPNIDVEECTSVTSLATLALLSIGTKNESILKAVNSALIWTAGQVYPDGLSLSLVLARIFNQPPAHAPGSVAWYPGTAGWITPTALTTLTLLRAAKQRHSGEFHQLASLSCSYLLNRRCSDNGWNHGGSTTRSEDALSYPETTGLALLALRAASIALPPSAVTLARQFAKNPESMEGLSWIQMALQTPSESISDPQVMPQSRTNRDFALRLLALSAGEGRNVLLSRDQG